MNIEFSPLCLGRIGKSLLFDELHKLCDSVHLDYMDGIFVNNKAFTIEDINSFKSQKPIHIHLMCQNPLQISEQLGLFSSVSAHIETNEAFNLFMKYMINSKKDWGVVISPNTAIERILNLEEAPKRIILMAVHPGYSAQPFLEGTLDRISHIRELMPSSEIVIDGGMNKNTIKLCIERKANSFVICTDLVRAGDRIKYIKDLKSK